MKTNAKATCFGVCLSAWLGLAAAPAARAQLSPDLIMESYNSNMNAIVSGAINKATIDNILEKDRREGIDPNNGRKTGIVVGRPGSRPPLGATGEATNASASAASLAYGAPSAALKARTVQGYVDRLKAKNPVAAQAIATNFGPGKYDYGTIYRGIVDGQGLHENDAADALSAYLIIGWMIVNDVRDGKAVTVPMAQGVRRQFAPKLAANPRLTAPGVPAQLGEEMKLLLVVVQGGWQSAMKEHTLPAYQRGIAALYKNQYGLDLAQLQLTDRGFASKAAAGAPGAATHPAAGAPAASAPPAGGAAGGANWFFRAISGNGGGVAFEPVVLFANGTYCEAGDGPVETLAPAADRAARPRAWGTWQKQGNAFVLTDNQRRANSYTLGSGNWFPAYAYTGAVPLKRAYEKTSGGDYGAGTSALFINKIQFLDATHFRQGENMGISSPNAAGGRTSAAAGTYRLQGHTLALTYADGHTVRKSFALGAEGAPAHPVSTLVFIGGDAYSDTD